MLSDAPASRSGGPSGAALVGSRGFGSHPQDSLLDMIEEEGPSDAERQLTAQVSAHALLSWGCQLFKSACCSSSMALQAKNKKLHIPEFKIDRSFAGGADRAEFSMVAQDAHADVQFVEDVNFCVGGQAGKGSAAGTARSAGPTAHRSCTCL